MKRNVCRNHHRKRCLQVNQEDAVWDVKQKVLQTLPKLKYKKRVYKMLNMDEKALKHLHAKGNLKKFMDYVTKSQTEKIDKWVKQGMDPNFHDPNGETPLTVAAAIPHSRQLIMSLVNGGAHLDFRNLEGQTALHRAAYESTQANVKTLLELGASPNYKGSSINYVTAACKNGLVQNLEHLLYYGADMNCQNVNGNTPLHVCSVNNRENCARVLLFRGADWALLNKQGQSALQVAVICGHPAVADVIRSHDPNQAVPYRCMPRYNSKRRLSRNNLARTRSFSQSSDYGTLPFGSRSASRISSLEPCSSGSGTASPVPSINSTSTITGGGGAGQDPARAPADPCATLTLEDRSTILRTMRKSISSDATDLRMGTTAPPGGHNGYYGVGSLKKFVPETVVARSQNGAVVQNGVDVNIARILVIPRGPKGFGFILRGAKKMEPGVLFEPTPAIPALQFFEGVDMNGMAMKAGLKPGDFLLEINGVDVRCASHDQVVQLIQISGDTISLKVITIDTGMISICGTASNGKQQNPHVHYGTLPVRRKYSAVKNGLPPMPPVRNPSTSLSAARGLIYARGMMRYEIPTFATDPLPRHQRPLLPAKSMELLPNGYKDPQTWQVQLRDEREREKVASVRGRVNSRRISAAELEQLMARQSSSIELDSSMDSAPDTPSSCARQGPRVYASVADMKRARQQKMGMCLPVGPVSVPAAPPMVGGGLPRIPPDRQESNGVLKSFHSSPDLHKDPPGMASGEISSELALARDIVSSPRSNGTYGYWRQGPVDQSPSPDPATKSFRRVVSVEVNRCENYSPPTYQRSILRPKTPPPPPPTHSSRIPPPPVSEAPPPPPPPPPELLRQAPATPSKGDCRGVTVEALNSVKLNKTPSPEVKKDNGFRTPLSRGQSAPVVPGSAPATGGITPETLNSVRLKSTSGAIDRTKKSKGSSTNYVAPPVVKKLTPRSLELQQQSGATVFSSENKTPGKNKPLPSVPPSGRNNGRVGLSLKESVQQQNLGEKSTQQQHSPPFAGIKKDSGYTSSRNSLEPSECGDESPSPPSAANQQPNDVIIPESPDFPPPPPPEILNAALNTPDSENYSPANHRVSLLSQQLEDRVGVTKPTPPPKLIGQKFKQTTTLVVDQQDTVSVASTLSTLSGCSEAPSYATTSSSQSRTGANQHSPLGHVAEEMPALPPPDYDEADSGTGDSESEDASGQNLGGKNNFKDKILPLWTLADVCDWLDSLYMGEYKRSFTRAAIDGNKLMACDRAQFTKLGVTRIAHRISMEKSLKNYKPSTTTAF